MIFKGNDFNFDLGKRTYVMGILNVTADSFSDGGKYNTPQKAKEHTEKMLTEGAHIIDIGAQSTKPGSTLLSADEELEIIKEYLPFLSREFDCVFSVDTFYPQVAEYALNNGASIINDVSGIFNEEMARLVLKYNCGWITTHTGGGNASVVPHYENGVVNDVISYFDDFLNKCDSVGISHSSLILDVGIGFGKSYDHNIEILKSLKKIKRDGVALMTALSLKRVIGTATSCDDNERLYGTISANALAIAGGTDFIRVHNVKENVLGARMIDAIVRD